MGPVHATRPAMLLDLVFLAAGLVALVFAGDKLVAGAVALASRLRISPLVIGLTIVAFGTSAPELFISLQAAWGGQPGLAIGNVVGSNVANVLLVLGAPALISAIDCHESGIGKSNIAMIAFTAVFMAMLASGGVLGRGEAFVLFAGLCAFLVLQWFAARRDQGLAEGFVEEATGDELSNRAIAVALLVGIVGLPLGAQLTINGATGIATVFGISDAVIGLTVVAIGTSLPELITSVMAAVRRSNEVAIGNVVGSNIFNIGAIMGITGMVLPLEVPAQVVSLDMWVMLAATLLLVGLATFRVTLGRVAGAAMLAVYVAYLVALY